MKISNIPMFEKLKLCFVEVSSTLIKATLTYKEESSLLIPVQISIGNLSKIERCEI